MKWITVFLLQWFGARVSHSYINMLDKLFRLIAIGWKYLKNYILVLVLFLTYHMNELVISFKLVTCLKYDNSIVGLKMYHPIWMNVFQLLVHLLLRNFFLHWGFTCIAYYRDPIVFQLSAFLRCPLWLLFGYRCIGLQINFFVMVTFCNLLILTCYLSFTSGNRICECFQVQVIYVHYYNCNNVLYV